MTAVPETSTPLAMLRRLQWRVKHAAENVLSGEYRSAFRGRGMEFDQVVKYEFGDDVRDIDWNVTARRGEPYRKKFIEEREITVVVVVEDSPTLQFGSQERTKREVLFELVALLGLLSAANRDRFGALYVSPSGHWFGQPARGRNGIMHTSATLLSKPAPEMGRHPGIEIPWKLLFHSIPRHSVLIWLGDFPPRPAPEAWLALRRRYQTMGFRVDDPWERTLPSSGDLMAYDPTTGGLVMLSTSSPAQRRRHAEWVARREMDWEGLFPDPLTRMRVTTQQSMLDALVAFFQSRMRRTR